MKRSTIALTIEDFGKTAVDIGRLAENKAVQVRVDLSKILLQEPKATASLVVESPSGDKYPAITRMEGKILIWDVAAADVASAGKGKVQLNVIGTNGEVLKSAVAVIRISGSIVGNGQAPNPVQNWIDSATKALNEAYAIVAELQQKLDDGEFVGPQGDPGATGATPNIQIGSVETGNPGTDAEASMSGTPEAPILNLKIPRGADGSGSVSKVDGVWPASGNVPLGAVRYSAAQNLTEAQQAQARENISAAKNAAMTGATASAAGAGGLVPAPAAGDQEKVLHGNGTWKKIDLSGKTVDITATELTGKSTADRAAMYAAGTRLLKVVNGDTEVLLGLDADGSAEWLGSNKPLNNLLDNSNFSNAVNQRGASSYTGIGYGIDRWFGRINAQTVEVRSTDVTATSTSNGYAGIKQKIENIAKYAGKTVTLCARLYSTSTVGVGFADANGDDLITQTAEGSTSVKVLACTYTVPADATPDSLVPLIKVQGINNAYMRIYWAALYEGSYTADTLPPYTPKGYAAELAECQRYFVSVSYNKTMLCGNTGNASGVGARIYLSLGTRMRINPTVSAFVVSASYYGGTKNNLTFTPSNADVNNTGLCFYGNFSSAVSESPTYVDVVYQIHNADLEISADL